jgi:hypothetical protein
MGSVDVEDSAEIRRIQRAEAVDQGHRWNDRAHELRVRSALGSGAPVFNQAPRPSAVDVVDPQIG